MTHVAESTLAEHARQVIARTASVWRIAPASPREVARRAPHGYVSLRIVRRMHAAIVASQRPVFAHSW